MKSFLKTHPFMKVLSLGLAIFLWVFVRGERRIEVSVNVPVQMEDLPDNLVIDGDIEPTLDLRLEGPYTRVSKMNNHSFAPYKINLRGARKGRNVFRIHSEDFEIPYGVQVKRILPESIDVRLEEAEEQLLEVKPKFVGLRSELEIASYEVRPTHVRVRGTSRRLARFPEIRTEPISLTDQKEELEGDFVLDSPEGLFGIGEKKVHVKVFLRKKALPKPGSS